ncbi:MAG: LysR substrate-binding domain-containing protein [Myxococcota bacterium]
MLDLNDYRLFVLAVDHGGFAAAGRATSIPKSTLSRRVSALESHLGVRLVERTSRRFVITEVGRLFYRHAKAMVLEAAAAEQAVESRIAEPAGTVRITCSVGMAGALGPILVRFLEAHPKVELVQHATNKSVDLVEEGFDIAIRGHHGALPDSTLIQRRIAATPWHAFAAPAYCREVGPLSYPSDLTDIPALVVGVNENDSTWNFYRRDEHTSVAIRPRVRSSDMEALKMAAIAGLGIASLPAYVAAAAVERGALERVLPEWVTQQAHISVLMPPLRSQLPSVRALVDFLVEEYPRVLGPNESV